MKLNTDPRIHSLAQAVLSGDLIERGRKNALRLYLNTALVIENNTKNKLINSNDDPF